MDALPDVDGKTESWALLSIQFSSEVPDTVVDVVPLITTTY